MNLEHRCGTRHSATMIVVTAAWVALSAAGCKSGMSAAKPTWWNFGGGQSQDPAKLATAPAFGNPASNQGGVAKPSGLASPYPTTSTPETYSMNGAVQPQVATVPAPQYPATADAAPITYSQVRQAAAETSANQAVVAGASQTGPSSAVVPQVGPYGTLPVSTQAPPVPGQASPDALMPASRIADSRTGDAFPSTPSAAGAASSFSSGASAPVESNPSSRYGDVNASRFRGADFSPSPDAVPPQPTPPAFRELAPAPSTAPVSDVPPPLESAPPRRRPDPGYRPGGTSSYRPSRSILVGEPTGESAVRTAGFDAASSEPVRQ